MKEAELPNEQFYFPEHVALKFSAAFLFQPRLDDKSLLAYEQTG